MVARPDSIEKIKHYLRSSSLKTFVLSKLFFRDYSCPEHCGGCCPKFSLDYFDGSDRWERFKKLYPDKVQNFKLREVDGVKIWTDFQDENFDHHCKHVDRSNARCTIHEANPFSCEFELNRFTVFEKKSKAVLSNRLFGRGWNLKKIDGTRGALCKMLGFNYEKFLRDLKLLKELLWISIQFKTKTKLEYLVSTLEANKEHIKEHQGSYRDVEFIDELSPNTLPESFTV